MADSFRFRRFEVRHCNSALKVGTDAVLLGAAMSIGGGETSALDIGTGCGVIALMVAQRTQACHITGIDTDRASAEEAAENFAASPWAGRLESLHVSLRDFRMSCLGCPDDPRGRSEAPAAPDDPVRSGIRFDLIFSNPPYYDDSLLNPDKREAAARHTHSLSHTELCSCVRDLLAPEGRFCVILPSGSFPRFRRVAASFGLLPYRLLDISTTSAKNPSRIIAEFSCNAAVPVREAVCLQCDGTRSEFFSEITKDFYL